MSIFINYGVEFIEYLNEPNQNAKSLELKFYPKWLIIQAAALMSQEMAKNNLLLKPYLHQSLILH